jgi:hypothetical protein
MAFRSHPEIAYLRMSLAFVAAVIIGQAVYRMVKYNPLKHPEGEEHAHHHGNRLFAALDHAADEFFDMGKYLLIGTMITALIQVTVSREYLLTIGAEGWTSHLFMAGFAYILSICSTSDAFIASSFVGMFSTGSLLTFLVFGPMLDLKNTMMMLAVFRKKFVIMLTVMIACTVLLCSYLFDIWLLP